MLGESYELQMLPRTAPRDGQWVILLDDLDVDRGLRELALYRTISAEKSWGEEYRLVKVSRVIVP